MKLLVSFLSIFSFIFLAPAVVYSADAIDDLLFECAFLEGKSNHQKSNKVSCSRVPEVVFSTSQTNQRLPHCKDSTTRHYTDFIDVKISAKLNKAVWTVHSGNTDDFKNYVIKLAVERGKSKAEAEKRANKVNEYFQEFDIMGYYQSSVPIYVGSNISIGFYKQEKQGKAHNMFLHKKNSNIGELKQGKAHNMLIHRKNSYIVESFYYLQIFEDSKDAYLISLATYDGSNSWIEIKFGKCRTLR